MNLKPTTCHPLLPRDYRRFLRGLLLLSALWPAVAQTAEEVTSAPTADAQDTSAQAPLVLEPLVIVITGRYSGPPLWKVTNGENVLWIFPWLSPVPEGLEWDSAQVAQALAESQEYLPLPQLDTGTVPRGLLLNPDRKKLGDVLPPALYERYLALKAAYFPRNRSLERLRPLAAGPSLVSGMSRKSGLIQGEAILREIDKLARGKRGLKTTAVRNAIDLFEGGVDETGNTIPLDQEFACFEKSLTKVQTEVSLQQRRANAWARGDMQELRDIFAISDAQDPDKPCSISILGSGTVSAETAELIGKHYEQWVAAAEAALTNNASTLAVLNLDMLLDSKGFLKLLRAKGYTVEEPD